MFYPSSLTSVQEYTSVSGFHHNKIVSLMFVMKWSIIKMFTEQGSDFSSVINVVVYGRDIAKYIVAVTGFKCRTRVRAALSPSSDSLYENPIQVRVSRMG